MNTFLKIINRISSKKDLYETKFLNFDYDGVSVFEETDRQKIVVFNNQIKDIKTSCEQLEREKDEINKKALEERLSKEESRKLALIFNQLSRNDATIKSLEKTMSDLSQSA